MNRLLAAAVPVVAVALLAVALVAAQEATPEAGLGIYSNELGTPCAGLPVSTPGGSPAVEPQATPLASPAASPEVFVIPGCPTVDGTPAGGTPPSE